MKKFLIFIIIFFITGGIMWAQDDAVLKSAVSLEKEHVYTAKISLDSIFKKAKEHSYDLKIADFNTLIAKQGIRSARSEYFPKLNFMAGTEYTKNFRDMKDTTVMTIGEAFINPYTRYQSLLGITLSYNLFDFGVRRGNLDIAKEDVTLKELEEQQKLQELNLNLIDTYTKILISKKQIDINKDILALEEKNLELKTRLFNAKEISKPDFNDAKVKVEQTKQKINELSSVMSESLEWLSFYTGEEYNIENLKVEDLKKSEFDVLASTDYTKSLVWKVYEKQLKKKELELKVAKRNYLPKVSVYSRYYLYGSDRSNYGKSFGIEPSNFTVGGMVNMPVFDGFKNSANVQRTILELKQLQVERDKAIAQLMTRLSVMRSNLIYLDERIENNNKILAQLTDKEKSMHRLNSKKIISPMEENDTKIQLLNEKIEYEKNFITHNAITRGIEILTKEN